MPFGHLSLLVLTLTMSTVLLQLIIPHTIQYKLFHGAEVKAENTHFDIDCCYYWYKLLQQATYTSCDNTIRKLTIEQLMRYTEPMTSVPDLAHRYFKGVVLNRRNNPSWLSRDATIGTSLLLEIALSDILEYVMSESLANQASHEEYELASGMIVRPRPNDGF
jgi:hypothetical protein